jgi:predicted Zn-dependent protease
VVRRVPELASQGSIVAALAALSARQPERAEAICREQLGTDPRSVDHLRLLGRALAMQSRLDEAEQALRGALVLRPDFPPLHEDLGGILAMQRRFEEAAATLSAAVRLDPRLPLARKKLAQALAALGRGAEADAALEAWFEQDARRAHVATALEHLRAGRKDDAISTLRKSLRENPDNVDALHTLAQAYWGDEERRSDIEALLRRATELAPALVPAWILLGMLLHESDRSEEAIECYRRAVDIEPDNASAWSGLGADYAQIGDMEKSASAYARSLALQAGPPGRPHELRARPQVPWASTGVPARVSRRHRAQAGLRRSVLEHGESEGFPVRAILKLRPCRSRCSATT